jgi:hypothetical protein
MIASPMYPLHAIASLAIVLEWVIVEANEGSVSVGFWRDFCGANECLGEQLKLDLKKAENFASFISPYNQRS